MPTVTLTRAPSLGSLLARGALFSPGKSLRLPRVAASGLVSPTRLPRLVLPGVRIDLARLAAYERVCGFPTGEDAVPLTYPHILGFPSAMRIMAGRDFPLPLLGLVHTSIEITRRRRLPATGEYEITVYVDQLTPHRRGTEATVVTEVRDGEETGGEAGAGDGAGIAWESRSTYLARHGGARAHGDAPAREGWGGGSESVGGGREGVPVVVEWRLGGDVGRRYGAVSGDRNPIHLHPLGARLFGFPHAIAHGMWTVARCLAEHGAPPATLVRAEFRAPVPLPGAVTYMADGRAWGGFELRGSGAAGLADATGSGGSGGAGGGRVHVRGQVYPLVA
ncbi:MULTISPECIES: MaoC/PaaZ C-terminal domain-containing protein [unclassified Streptomyces]|uniref:MaoC/PaaZ C-terminal domain-containing protein n=1 Tax=unclassified Streptomyces TaxID=2593676 RepID=UPI002E77F4D0|nr:MULTISPECIES: MaoC/PaaZ C-terminal domain-containing protein [unclassified Streptomyces]MEE1759538.1 MaoC/PaaZ C-terminal domain-containing protein [Streptomyces sp. SP18BB07]MEE1830579.1 MaoC/PaaZ C-terminal domain-containing protein [Streptomyces sp. SP17KL33]